MKKNAIKNLSRICSVLLILAMLPVSVFAANSLELDANTDQKVIFEDDFEKYTVGGNKFAEEMLSNGYNKEKSGSNDMSVEVDESGNKYLSLAAGSKTQTRNYVTTKITGDYTVQFDFCFERSDLTQQIVYTTMWQNTKLAEYTEIRKGSIVYEFKQYFNDAKNDLPDIHKTVKCKTTGDVWYTIKMTRTNGCIYTKVWEQGADEPAEWTGTSEHTIYDTSLESQFRFGYYCYAEETAHFYMDNLKITQNVAKSSTPAASAVPATGTAYASKQSVDLDGTATTFDMYMLVDENGGETNYIKLRDIAYLLNGTAAQFEVGYDGTISLTTGKAYTANGSELSTPFSGARAYKVCDTTIKVNGSAPALAGITLTDDAGGEYNYFKLRDLGTALGFKVDWSAERGIFVATK